MATALNVYENTIALTLAILSEEFLLPEHVWDKLANPSQERFKITNEDRRDIFMMVGQGISRKEIGSIYGISQSHISRIARDYRGSKNAKKGRRKIGGRING